MSPYGRLSLLTAVVVLAGCGSSHARRDAVNAYFNRVDAAEANLVASIGEIDVAFRAFALSGNKPTEVQELESAQNQIRSTLRAVRSIEPPPEATKVHGDLVELLSLQYEVAHELYWTTQFEPKYASDVAELKPAATAFASDLHAVGDPGSGAKPPHLTVGAALAGYGAAFSSYGASLEAIVRKLDGLSAPPELRPSFLLQRSALRGSVALCAQISSRLRAGDVSGANASIRRLFESATALNGPAAGEAAQRAARAYRRQVARIAELSARVTDDRARLVSEVG